MRLLVLGLVVVLLLVMSGTVVASDQESATDNDSVQVILFWSGASMRGHVVDSLDNKVVFKRTDGRRFDFKRDKIFAITDDAGYDDAYARLNSTPQPRSKEVVESLCGIGYLNNKDYSNIKLMAGVGVRFLDRMRISIVTEFNDLGRSDVVTWLLSFKYYIPVGEKALFLYAAPGLAVNTRKFYPEEGQYGFTCTAGVGIRTRLNEPVSLFAQVGYQYINIVSGPLVPKEYALKEDLLTLSGGLSFAMVQFKR